MAERLRDYIIKIEVEVCLAAKSEAEARTEVLSRMNVPYMRRNKITEVKEY